MGKLSNTKVTALISYIAVFFNVLIGVLLTPFIIRELGNSQYGLYSICSSLIGFFLLDFGLGSAASRFISKYHVKNDQENEKNTIGTIFRLFLYIDAVVLLILLIIFCCIDRIYTGLTLQELKTLKVVFLISTFSSVFSFPFNILNGILTAYGKYVYSKIATIIGKVFVTIFTVLVLSMDWGLHAFVIVHALESVLNVGYKYYVVRKHTGAKLQLSFYDKNLAKDIIRFAMWITIMAISHRLIFTVVPSILGIVSNTTEAARFGVVLTIENYLYIISTAFSGMFMPTVSRIYNESDFENKLVELVVKICKLIYGINVLIFVGLLFLGGDFLRLWAGNEYEAVHLGLLMVVFPTMFYNTAEVLNTAVMVKNKVKYSALINFAAGILNVLCCFTASRYWGANGACLSIMIATSLRTVLTYVLYQKVLHISVKTVIIESYVKTLPAVLVTAGFGILGKIFVLNSGWIGFVLKGIALVAGAAVGTLLFMRKDLFPDHRK